MLCNVTIVCSLFISIYGVHQALYSFPTRRSSDLAYFLPTRIRRTRRALELSSESSYRFERGIDMLGMPDALRRAIELIVAVAGGDLREPPWRSLWPRRTAASRYRCRGGAPM